MIFRYAGSHDMLTLFSTPKPFRGHINIIQRNALESWRRLDPDAEIILFGDDEGAAEVCRELGLRHEPKVLRSEFVRASCWLAAAGTRISPSPWISPGRIGKRESLRGLTAKARTASTIASTISLSPGGFTRTCRRWSLDETRGTTGLFGGRDSLGCRS